MPAFNEEETERYFELLKLSETLKGCIHELEEIYRKISGNSPEYIFIENERNSDDIIIETNVAFFHGETYVDMPIPKSPPSFSIVKLTPIKSMRLMYDDQFDFDRALPKSTLEVGLFSGGRPTSNFKAAGENCTVLLQMIKELLIPKL